MSAEPVIVIGAGPAGLACAVKLVDHGVPVLVLEASPHVGGLARSFELWGQQVDLGPHRFFSSDRIVVDLWRRFVRDDFTMVKRLTRILYGGKWFQYPLQPLDAFRQLGLPDVGHSLASYAWRRLRPRPSPKSFEDWVTNRFGGHLFRIFFKTYSEKVWGLPCTQLDADWAAQRIKRLSLGEAVKAAVRGNRAQHATLLDEFAYPLAGAGVVYERMDAHVRAHGGEVKRAAPVKRVLRDAQGVRGVELLDGTQHLARKVVSTMPLTTLVKGLDAVPEPVRAASERLRFRNTLLVYVEVDAAGLFPDNWVYVHDPHVRHGRITNFRNWSPRSREGSRSTVLCLEFWCFDEDELWSRDDDALARLARDELTQIGVLGTAKVTRSHVVRLRRSYPVYELGYRALLEPVQAFVDAVPGLLAIGRYGAFKYNNQDHSLLMGLLAATELLSGQRQQLWHVNTGDTYQESAEVRGLFSS